MNGIIKKIKDIFPVTTTKAVYIDGTNKTLQQAIDNGEIGGNTTATTSGRGYVEIKLRGSMVIVELVEESISSPSRVKYSFPTGDSDRLRNMYVWTPSGGIKGMHLPDGTLALNEALIYNFDTNTTRTVIESWGNVIHANNEIVLWFAINPEVLDTSILIILNPKSSKKCLAMLSLCLQKGSIVHAALNRSGYFFIAS